MRGSPVPLSQFVLKVHSRCDLACDHCYVYEAADQSWRGRPTVISDDVISRTARRIADYASSQALSAVQVVLHGGEPLLAGPVRLRRVVTELREALNGLCDLDLRIHTNGVLLSEQYCELFAEHDVKVGISIDGDRAANDRHRRYADGRSSYDKVVRAIGLLRTGPFRHLYAGLLCTIDTANDPLVVYESLMNLRPPRIDFLLPHATWDHPPRREPNRDSEYADWLIAIFDQWLMEGCPARIRTFDSILSTLRGGGSYTEALGLDPVSLLVIETDGSYEQVDSLKAAFDGAPETGSDVFSDPIDLVAAHPGILARQQGVAGLCQTCQECPVVTTCGGGLYTHRYRTGTGFANPSVYCSDLFKLISHIGSRLPGEPGDARSAPVHALSGGHFRALAAGFGDAAALMQLTEAERGLSRDLLSAVYQAAMAAPHVSAAAKARLHSAWSLLTTLDREQPAALGTVLGHPYIRVWAKRCLEQLRSADAWPDSENEVCDSRKLAADLDHLGAVAAVAAARARVGAAVTVPVINSAVHLPTFGRLVLGNDEAVTPADGDLETATVSVISNAVIIRVADSYWTLALGPLLDGEPCGVPVPGNARSGEWQPVRVLNMGGLLVALEDTDPFRVFHQWQVAPRLSDTEFGQWQSRSRGAWQEIQRQHRAYAPALGAGLTTLVPLAAAQDGQGVSTASRQAFGAVAVALPADAATLAGLLIHEFQRVKLGAVLDLCDLYNPADDSLFPAPWGAEKLQVGGLLQGAYARLAVADVWRARQHAAAGLAAEEAGRRFVQWGAQTREAIDALLSSDSLTPLGTSFVREMRRSIPVEPDGPARRQREWDEE
jgi:uncharacterized protein